MRKFTIKTAERKKKPATETSCSADCAIVNLGSRGVAIRIPLAFLDLILDSSQAYVESESSYMDEEISMLGELNGSVQSKRRYIKRLQSALAYFDI